MKKAGFVVLAALLTVYSLGCKKKPQVSEELRQEPMTMEALSTINTESKPTIDVTIPDAKAVTSQTTASTSSSDGKLDPLPPSGPYKPTVIEIQTALKNAGFYTGQIDGKSGPVTKKAIEDFQKANGLQADGVVGIKTWALLSKNLNTAAGLTEAVSSDVSKKIVLPIKKR